VDPDPDPDPRARHRLADGRREGHGRRLLLSAVVLLVTISIGTMGSWAAWTVSDANPNNSFSTSTVLLQDNQGGQAGSATSSGTAMFNVSNLSPGSSATTACIGVVFSGAAAATLTLGASLGGAGRNVLQTELTMDVAQYNTGGTVTVNGSNNVNGGSCAGYPVGGANVTVGAQGATLQNWAAGGAYSIAGPVTNTWYKFTVSGLPPGDTSCATYCNQTITITLTWTLTTV
jgi:hypothetical protein